MTAPPPTSLIAVGVVFVFLGAIVLVAGIRANWRHQADAVVGEAERTIVRHDLDNGT